MTEGITNCNKFLMFLDACARGGEYDAETQYRIFGRIAGLGENDVADAVSSAAAAGYITISDEQDA